MQVQALQSHWFGGFGDSTCLTLWQRGFSEKWCGACRCRDKQVQVEAIYNFVAVGQRLAVEVHYFIICFANSDPIGLHATLFDFRLG